MVITRTAEAYEILKQSVINGDYAPGSQLRIDTTSNTLKGSAGAVREALSRLTAEGLVLAIPQKGFVVAPISIGDLSDLTEVRIEIETRCLRRSIARGDIAWEGRVISTHHQLSRTPMVSPDNKDQMNPDWTRLHSEFHDAIISECDSDWWLKLRNHMFLQAERYRQLGIPYSNIERDIEEEHRDIMEAVVARDQDRAIELLSNHIQRTADILMAEGVKEVVM